MAVKLSTDHIQDLQQVEVAVSGPDGANRLFIISGRVDFSFFTTSINTDTVYKKENFMILMGPTLTRRQFISASGITGIIGTQVDLASTPASFRWAISTTDVDWDDQSGKVELTMEILVDSAGTNNRAGLDAFSFQVMVLAEVTP